MNPSAFAIVPGPMSPMISKVIRSQTRERDVVLDPFSVYGRSAFEILRLGRRAVAVERDPVSAFLAEVLLRPASLPILHWAFEDVRNICREETAALFTTSCPKCGTRGTIAAVDRRDGKVVRIDYYCSCAEKRLTKKPDPADQSADDGLARLEIPYWHPVLQLTAADGSRRYPSDFINRRTAAALSIILHAVEAQAETSARDVLRAVFASALELEGSSGSPTRGRKPEKSRRRAGREPVVCIRSRLPDVVRNENGKQSDTQGCGNRPLLRRSGGGTRPRAHPDRSGSRSRRRTASPRDPSTWRWCACRRVPPASNTTGERSRPPG